VDTQIRIDQIIPSIVQYDAVSNHTFAMQKILKEMGFASEIYVDIIGPGCESRVYDLSELEKYNSSDRILIYQYSIGSRAANYFMAAKGRKLVDYHNIAPAHFFNKWLPPLAAESVLGRSQMAPLSKISAFAFADSQYNADELVDAGFGKVEVLPVLIDANNLEEQPNQRLLSSLKSHSKSKGAKWLFVGQIAPHKAQHNLIKAFYCYLKAYDTEAHLYIVGKEMGNLYRDAVMNFANEINLANSVTFTGSVTSSELVSYYRGCDVFVSLSEHEGFCVPIIEAMNQGIPVVAYGKAAVPETLGDAGIILDNNDPYEIAAAVNLLLNDSSLREDLISKGKKNVERYSLHATEEKFKSIIRDVAKGL